jgi:hypothetical protein
MMCLVDAPLLERPDLTAHDPQPVSVELSYDETIEARWGRAKSHARLGDPKALWSSLAAQRHKIGFTPNSATFQRWRSPA